jgi:protein-S-isoprenylcysteine O-methyltransferase Ste14
MYNACIYHLSACIWQRVFYKEWRARRHALQHQPILQPTSRSVLAILLMQVSPCLLVRFRCLPAMNNTLGPTGPASIDSAPSTLEIVIGLLALVLALAAVVVGFAQYLQNRTGKRRRSVTESGIETQVIPTHHSDTEPIRSGQR